MPLHLFLFVLTGAAIHVGWNAIARATAAKSSFLWLTAVVGVVVLAPLFAWSRLQDPGPIDARALKFAALSGALEAIYFLLLQESYGRAELSLVYPLSRGVAPILALVPARIWTGEALTSRELAAIAIVLTGALVLARTSIGTTDIDVGEETKDGRTTRDVRGVRIHGVAFALGVALAIAAYQLVDGVALRGATAPRPVEYQFLLQLVLATLLTIAFAVRGGFGSRALVGTRDSLAGTRPRLSHVVAAGIAMQAAYLLILLALRDGKIPLVIAARNGGIPLSLLVGRLALKERLTARRIVASLTIVAGVLLLVDWRA